MCDIVLEFRAPFCFNQAITTTFIYALTDPRPGDTHVYIGKADRPRRRFMEHYWELPDDRSRKGNWLRSLAALGLKPTQEIVREVPMWEWQVWEMTFIRWYRALGWNVVNTTEGGDGLINPTDEVRAKCALGRKGKSHTPEARAAIGASSRGKPRTAEHRAKISAAWQREKDSGHKRKLSAEHRANIAASLKGKELSLAHRQHIRDAQLANPPMKGRHHSLEARRAISAAFKGKPLSPEHRAKIAATKVGALNPMFGKTGASNPMYGNVHTSETRAKISASQKKQLTLPQISASVASSL